ncbi:MAG: methyltransferase domain-containing protein [Betaproteobacteria bacterium]|nr:MAG: methyltransferase domain-containing protein [Betaproteobacteria bacterium]
MSAAHQAVISHYGVGDLGTRILEALRAAGKDIEHLAPGDLAPLDAFHIRGRDASRELAVLAQLDATHRVLDIGSGIGGSARYLAAEYGCHVTGIDLTEEYCRVATLLSERCGLAARTAFRAASALELPYPDASFDLAWTEHVQMNVADKARFYGEIRRVLVPGGKLLFHDVFRGPAGEPYFPVPWAGDASISHLEAPEEVARLLQSLGLRRRHWEDVTAKSLAWFRALLERFATRGRPPLGLHLLMGADASQKFENLVRNLDEARIVVVQAVYET